MKSNRHSFLLPVIAAGVLALAGTGLAQTNAYDDAFHYAFNSSGWPTNTLNGGFGFTSWARTTNGPGSHGFFTTANGSPVATATNSSSPPGADNNQHVWGVFANGTGLNTAVAYRGFSNSLDTTVVFKMQWRCLGIGNGNTNLGGFVLRNGNSTNGTTDLRTGQRFSFYYIAGGNNSFTVSDGNGVNYIGLPFTSSGLSCEFTLEPNDTYRFVVKNVTNNAILVLLDGQPLAGSGTIDSVAIFAQQTSANQEFDRMQIVSTSLIPPNIVNIQPTNGSIYVDPGSSNLTFEVDSAASTVGTNGIVLTLNGVTQSNLLFNTTTPTSQLMVTNTKALTPNTLYTATIIATDANGNRATNTTSFNTFITNLLFIEAEDYNYSAGGFINNQVNTGVNQYQGLFGTNGIDYLETDLSGTNPAAYYRPGDLPQILPVTGDPIDHNGLIAGGGSDFELGFTSASEWQNYTRLLDDTNYNIYVRAASGGGNGTILMERLVDPTATTTAQPRAALGTCIIPTTGGSKIYSGPLVPLTDFFSNPVQIRSSGTNTIRCTALSDRGYNLNYIVLVPVTNTGTLRPYLSSGFPFPSAVGVGLDSGISFTIANRQTAVNPATIQLLLDSNNVTGGISLNNNSAGTVVTYQPSGFLAPNVAHTLTAIFTDMGGSSNITTTNTWQFVTANSTLTILPGAYAQPIASGSNAGFAERIYKIDNSAPTAASIANAEAELAGLLTNASTGQPWPNLANGGPNGDGSYSEANTINYDITGGPTGTPTFPYKSPYPYVPAGAVNNNIAMAALMYLQLTNGSYVFNVRSDDGFRLTAGPTPGNTNLVLGQFDGGRGNNTPTTFYITVTNSGLYPMRLLHYQAGSGGNVEFYSMNNGTPVLINDPSNATSIKAFQSLAAAASPVTLLSPAHSGGSSSFSFLTQSGRTHFVEYKNLLTDPTWTPLVTISGSGSVTNVTDNAAGGGSRYYRVRTQ